MTFSKRVNLFLAFSKILYSLIFNQTEGNPDATLEEWEILPSDPRVGDILDIKGKTGPEENIGMAVSFNMQVPVIDNRYKYIFKGVRIPGGSNSLIFDKFFQLDFHPGQLVVLQFTMLDRLHYCNTDKQLIQLMLSSSPIEKNLHQAMLEVYHKDFLFYELLCKIKAIVKFARTQKLKLVFG